MLRKGMLGPRNPMFIYLLEHPFFFGEKNQRIIQARAEAYCCFRSLIRGTVHVDSPCASKPDLLLPILLHWRIDVIPRPNGPITLRLLSSIIIAVVVVQYAFRRLSKLNTTMT